MWTLSLVNQKQDEDFVALPCSTTAQKYSLSAPTRSVMYFLPALKCKIHESGKDLRNTQVDCVLHFAHADLVQSGLLLCCTTGIQLAAAGWRWALGPKACLMCPGDKAGGARGVMLTLSLGITPTAAKKWFVFLRLLVPCYRKRLTKGERGLRSRVFGTVNIWWAEVAKVLALCI